MLVIGDSILWSPVIFFAFMPNPDVTLVSVNILVRGKLSIVPVSLVSLIGS
mgnify:CR=1 FL=1